jgi:hypothetical protein
VIACRTRGHLTQWLEALSEELRHVPTTTNDNPTVLRDDHRPTADKTHNEFVFSDPRERRSSWVLDAVSRNWILPCNASHRPHIAPGLSLGGGYKSG